MKEIINWYALKIFYNKALHFKELVEKDGVETYLAMTSKEVKESGRIQHQKKPLVSSLMFIRSTEDYLNSLREHHFSELTYYKTAHFILQPGNNSVEYVPAIIPEDQMEVFRQATTEGGNIQYLGTIKSLNLKPGDRVMVTEGPFKGREGYLKRIKKDRKFVITRGNIAAFTIEGITYKMVKRIDNNNSLSRNT